MERCPVTWPTSPRVGAARVVGGWFSCRKPAFQRVWRFVIPALVTAHHETIPAVTYYRPALIAAPVCACLVALAGCTATQPSPASPSPAVASSGPPSGTTSGSPTPSVPVPTPSAPGQPKTNKAAADAFHTWVNQYNSEQWDRHYATLVTAQRKVISEKRYTACRDASTNPTFKWIKTTKTKADVPSKIPGTSTTQRATLVIARLRVQGWTLPVTAHMFYENGEWHWSMTKENIARCKK